MRQIALPVLILLSFAAAKLLLWFASPNDPEGANLLVTTVMAVVIFVPLWLVYTFIFKKKINTN